MGQQLRDPQQRAPTFISRRFTLPGRGAANSTSSFFLQSLTEAWRGIGEAIVLKLQG